MLIDIDGTYFIPALWYVAQWVWEKSWKNDKIWQATNFARPSIWVRRLDISLSQDPAGHLLEFQRAQNPQPESEPAKKSIE